MRACIIAFFLFVAGSSLRGQFVSNEYILSSRKVEIERYDTTHLKFYQTMIPFGFKGVEFQDTTNLKILHDKAIYRVDLVYSRFRESNTFNQLKLNKERLNELRKWLPYLFDNNAVEWVLVEQKEEHSREAAEQLFHGFVFYTREAVMRRPDGKVVKLGRKEELKIVRYLMNDSLAKNWKTTSRIENVEVCDTILDTIVHIAKHSTPTGRFYPKLGRKEAKGIMYSKSGFWHRRQEIEAFSDTTQKAVSRIDCHTERKRTTIPGTEWEMPEHCFFSMQPDTVVKKTLNSREWENVLIVEDVTGSMFPYIGQTIEWKRMKVAAQKTNDFAFFNDGDSHPDGPVGKSKGVYYVHSSNVDSIEKTVLKAMMKGFGGALPENNIEALIRARDECKSTVDRILLVVDNWAPVRDMELLAYFTRNKKRVDVIVCGTYGQGINHHYLEIARKTGGTVFTIEHEIENISELAEGQELMIGNQKFKIKGGDLVLTR